MLWTNPAPNNTFPVGTKINVDLSNHEYILILMTSNNGEDATKIKVAHCMKVGESKSFYIITQGHGRTVTFAATPSSVTKTAVDSSTVNVGSKYGIPTAIYGLNYYLDIGMFAD